MYQTGFKYGNTALIRTNIACFTLRLGSVGKEMITTHVNGSRSWAWDHQNSLV